MSWDMFKSGKPIVWPKHLRILEHQDALPSSFAQCTANPGPASEGRTSLNLFLQFKCFCNDIVFGRWGWMGRLWFIHLTCQWLASIAGCTRRVLRRVAVTLIICNTYSGMPDTILTVTDRWSDAAHDQFWELGWRWPPGKDAKSKLFPNLILAYLGLIPKTSCVKAFPLSNLQQGIVVHLRLCCLAERARQWRLMFQTISALSMTFLVITCDYHWLSTIWIAIKIDEHCRWLNTLECIRMFVLPS